MEQTKPSPPQGAFGEYLASAWLGLFCRNTFAALAGWEPAAGKSACPTPPNPTLAWGPAVMEVRTAARGRVSYLEC